MGDCYLPSINSGSQPAWRVTPTALSCNRLSGHLVSPPADFLQGSRPDLKPKHILVSTGRLPCRDGASSDGGTDKPGLETGPVDDGTTGSELYWADKPHWHWQTYKEDLAVSRGCLGILVEKFQADTHAHTLQARCSNSALLHHG